ncbi:MAG: hypothetical protein CML06_17340 [Pseudomonadales bacterium]|nr:hypothetical protein [Pseudomonadales bacterium]
MMPKVCVIQPILASYRDPIFRELNHLLGNELLVCASPAPTGFGRIQNPVYEIHDPGWKKLGMFSYMPVRSLRQLLRRSDRFIHFGDFKFLSLWFLMFYCFFSHKKLWLHGQGGYKRSGPLHRLVYSLSVFLCEGYICYTEYSAQALKKILPRSLRHKVIVVSNTLAMEPAECHRNPETGSSLLYIGRLRKGCGIELLLESAARLKLTVKVIGEGPAGYVDKLKAQFPSARFYGGVFDPQQQEDIARDCMAGVYGGDAGLSVVHYMALGLPVIVHGDIKKHMGPEPSYVVDGVNGLVFLRGDVESLVNCIAQLRDSKALRQSLGEGALETFKRLMKPSMAQKLARILEN